MPSSSNPKREARILLATWVVLVSLTLGSFWMAESSTASPGATALWVLGIAALKSLAIAGVFMEMRRAPRAAAVAMSAFLFVEAALLVTILP